MTLFLELTILFLLILLNGVLAMAEIALVSARRSRLETQAAQGKRSAKIALNLANKPGRFLATVQIGITLVGIMAGAFGEATLAKAIDGALQNFPLLAPYGQIISLILVVISITYLSLIFGELAPKRVALNNPEKTAIRIAPAMQLLSTLTAPLSHLLGKSTDLVLRLVGSQTTNEPAVTEEDIKALVRQGAQAGVLAVVEQQMVSGVFRLGDRRADAMLTPRTEIEWLDLKKPLTEQKQIVLSSSHSVFPVARDSLDQIVGIISAKDLLAKLLSKSNKILKESDLQQALFVPGSTPVLQILQTIRHSNHPMVFVMDEFSGLSGLITPQNILDAIYGESFQTEQKPGKTDKTKSWLLPGLTPVDQLVEILPLQDPPPLAGRHYKTLGGMITTHLGHIPNPGEKIIYNGWQFEVLTMDRLRVDQVRITKEIIED
jgi:putative hemolysin